ncbi:MAG: type II toxin-antitoxin system RelE/ParE family toxin [Bacteroidota bacterium]|nr:type II toxin-antitoxin system RelE/ParE family toxin [Bacteroidota bacterium]
MYEVIIEEHAALEIEEVYFWYENKLSGLGEKFKEDLDKRIQILYNHPHTFSFITSLHRRAPLKKFPYFIIYRVIEKTVIILSVIYGGRNSEELQSEW